MSRLTVDDSEVQFPDCLSTEARKCCHQVAGRRQLFHESVTQGTSRLLMVRLRASPAIAVSAPRERLAANASLPQPAGQPKAPDRCQSLGCTSQRFTAVVYSTTKHLFTTNCKQGHVHDWYNERWLPDQARLKLQHFANRVQVSAASSHGPVQEDAAAQKDATSQPKVWGCPFMHNEVAPGSQNFSAILIVAGKAFENLRLNMTMQTTR